MTIRCGNFAGRNTMMTAGAKCNKLIEQCALRPLRSEADLDAALKVAEKLYLNLKSLTKEESDYLEVLSDLIGNYEDEHHRLPDDKESTPAELLRWLMEVNGMKQVDLAKVLGVSTGRASEIDNGVRDLSKAQISAVADHFHVRADMFLSKKTNKTSLRTQATVKTAFDRDYKREQSKQENAAHSVREAAETKFSKLKKAAAPEQKGKRK